MTSAQMRASHMQSNVACLDVLTEAAAIRRSCASLIRPVEAALRISWLPLELNTALIEEVESTCGSEEARKWVYASIRRSMHGTLLRPVVDGLTRLGLGPQHGLRRCSYGWDMLYKHAGRIECTHAEVGEATLVLRDAPEMARTPSYLRALAFAFEGIAVELGGDDVEAEVTEGTHMEFSMRWKPRV
ncbi:MAG: hypothetical protein AB8H86_03555 [Polyangiales bacterium]